MKITNKYRHPLFSIAFSALLCPALTSCQSPASAPDCTPEETNSISVASDAGMQDSAYPAVKVDTSQPLSLEKWRTIHEEGKAAIKVSDLDTRIAKLQTFVNQHRDHEQLGELLESLIDALIDRGDFDPGELATYVKRLAEADDNDSNLPAELVRKYHVKHVLPLESGIELLAMARARLAKERAELVLETSENYREWRDLRLNYLETGTHTVEGHLLLVHGQPKRALAALDRGRQHSAKFPKDIVLYNADGESMQTFAAGAMDKLYVLQAAAHHKLGNELAAKESLQNVVGFLGEVDIRTKYNKLRKSLAVGPKDPIVVKTAPELAQDFSLKDLDGNTVTLSSFRGKVVLLTFWASWCGPCKDELPILQKFARSHSDDVEVLSINLDDFSERAKVRPFLESRNLDITVLLKDEEQLSSYNYDMVPALYVIDREGRIALARTGFVNDLQEKLKTEILPLVEGTANANRELFVIEEAPQNWGVLWKQSVSGGLNAIAIAPPLGSAAGEVGAVGRKGLIRWTGSGEASEPKPVPGWNRDLRAGDLDGDGQREWISSSWSSLKVLDSMGEMYWQHEGHSVSVYGIRDVNADGFGELVTSGDGRVTVMKSVPEPLWQSHKFKDMKTTELDPAGAIIVQADERLWSLDQATGAATGGEAVPKGRILGGRTRTEDGAALDYFKGRWDPTPKIEYDLDGDGQLDVILTKDEGVVAYNTDGEVLLRIRSGDVELTTSIGDLDGQPGAELAIAVQHYGVVVLGKK